MINEEITILSEYELNSWKFDNTTTKSWYAYTGRFIDGRKVVLQGLERDSYPSLTVTSRTSKEDLLRLARNLIGEKRPEFLEDHDGRWSISYRLESVTRDRTVKILRRYNPNPMNALKSVGNIAKSVFLSPPSHYGHRRSERDMTDVGPYFLTNPGDESSYETSKGGYETLLSASILYSADNPSLGLYFRENIDTIQK